MENELKKILNEMLFDSMSRICYSEVTDELLNELSYAVTNNISIYCVLDDNLSRCAIKELEEDGFINKAKNLVNIGN